MSELWEGLQSVLPIGLLLEIEHFEIKNEDKEDVEKRLSPVTEEEEDEEEEEKSSILSFVGSDTYGSNVEFWAKPAQILLQIEDKLSIPEPEGKINHPYSVEKFSVYQVLNSTVAEWEPIIRSSSGC